MNPETAHSLLLSFKIALIATAGVVVLGTALGYLLARRDFTGRGALDALLMLPLVLPPTVTGYYLMILMGRRGLLGGMAYERFGISMLFTWQAAVAASFVVALPLMVKSARAAIESVDENLINASRTLGHSEFSIAARVIFPLAMRGMAAGAVLSFARALGEFGATLMVAGNIPGKTDTMPIAIYTKASAGDWSEANMLVLIFTLISCAFLMLSNYLTRKPV